MCYEQPRPDEAKAQSASFRITALAVAIFVSELRAEDLVRPPRPTEPVVRWASAASSAQRRERLTAPASIRVELQIVETRLGDGEAEVVFGQSYTSDRYSDRVRKSLHFVETDDGWKIHRETVLATL